MDTGVFVAAANRDDPDQAVCEVVLRDARVLTVPAPVVGEARYLIGKHMGSMSEATFLRMLADSKVRIESPTREDLLRTAELVDQYPTSPSEAPTPPSSPSLNASMSRPSQPSTTATSRSSARATSARWSSYPDPASACYLS